MQIFKDHLKFTKKYNLIGSQEAVLSEMNELYLELCCLRPDYNKIENELADVFLSYLNYDKTVTRAYNEFLRWIKVLFVYKGFKNIEECKHALYHLKHRYHDYKELDKKSIVGFYIDTALFLKPPTMSFTTYSNIILRKKVRLNNEKYERRKHDKFNS